MSDYKNHGDKPIEFCGDQEGWIAVGSLSDDSPLSPFHPRVVLLGVGLGPAGKEHPSNIAAMLTIAQATDLRTRLTDAMAVDRPAPTPPPAPGLDLDAVESALVNPASKTWLVTADKPVLPTLDDDSTETWVLSEEQARDISTTAYHDGATEIAIECHAVMPFDDVTALIAEVRALRETVAMLRADIARYYDALTSERAKLAEVKRLGMEACAVASAIAGDRIACDAAGIAAIAAALEAL